MEPVGGAPPADSISPARAFSMEKYALCAVMNWTSMHAQVGHRIAEGSVASIPIIHDDHAILATIKTLLARDAHDVAVTDGGCRRFSLLRIRALDLLVVDILMSAMDRLVHHGRPHTSVTLQRGFSTSC
jgi:hypothetical protein